MAYVLLKHGEYGVDSFRYETSTTYVLDRAVDPAKFSNELNKRLTFTVKVRGTQVPRMRSNGLLQGYIDIKFNSPPGTLGSRSKLLLQAVNRLMRDIEDAKIQSDLLSIIGVENEKTSH